MNRKKQIDQFAKLTEYMLGRRPDEFGLVPDNDGYIKIKEFLQAVIETEGWRNLRKNAINELMLVHPNPPVEVEETRIRAKNYLMLPKYTACDNPPKLLYTCVKQKSYPAVIENGVHPSTNAKIICCTDPEMAKKIGKRRSPQPVLLTIQTQKMLEQGMAFLYAGGLLYLTDLIPVDCFTGPSPPKEALVTKKTDKSPDTVNTYKSQTQAGSFTVSPDMLSEKKNFGKKKKNDDSWKNNKKRLRKEKKHFWPDQ